MKTIKFRAWDKQKNFIDLNKMYTGENPFLDEEGIDVNEIDIDNLPV